MHKLSDHGSASNGDPEKRSVDLRRVALRIGAPDNEVPGVIPLGVVLGRTDELVVALTSVQVFSTGLRLILMARMPSAVSGSRFFEEVFDHSHGGADWPQLLLGVEYADGRSAVYLPGRRRIAYELAAADDAAPVLSGDGGGGSDRSADMSFWLWPRPAEGDLMVVCAWPNRGVSETRTVIPSAALDAATASIQVLWPWKPAGDSSTSDPLPAPQLPDGWFREAIDTGEPR